MVSAFNDCHGFTKQQSLQQWLPDVELEERRLKDYLPRVDIVGKHDQLVLTVPVLDEVKWLLDVAHNNPRSHCYDIYNEIRQFLKQTNIIITTEVKEKTRALRVCCNTEDKRESAYTTHPPVSDLMQNGGCLLL